MPLIAVYPQKSFSAFSGQSGCGTTTALKRKKYGCRFTGKKMGMARWSGAGYMEDTRVTTQDFARYTNVRAQIEGCGNALL